MLEVISLEISTVSHQTAQESTKIVAANFISEQLKVRSLSLFPRIILFLPLLHFPQEFPEFRQTHFHPDV